MIDPVSEFLVTYPTTAKWLDDIINALLHEPRGTAHVHKLAHRDARRLSIDQSIRAGLRRCRRRRERNPADGVAVVPDWCATLGPLWVPILAGSPLEAPDGLKAHIAPIPTP